LKLRLQCQGVGFKVKTQSQAHNVCEVWEKEIMKKIAGKKFVKIIVSEKGSKKVAKPQLTNGAKMNC